MRIPEQPKENPFDHPTDQPKEVKTRAETPREQQMVAERTSVVENTRTALEELAMRLPQPEGARQNRFVA